MVQVKEEHQKLIESIKETERTTQKLADKAASETMFDFYEGMACGYRYCLALLEIWRDRILGREENEERTCEDCLKAQPAWKICLRTITKISRTQKACEHYEKA